MLTPPKAAVSVTSGHTRLKPPIAMRNGATIHHKSLVERNLPMLGEMTFVKMLRPNLRFLAHLEGLEWLSNPSVRRDQATLTDIEKTRYLCAFDMINKDGTLGRLVDIHAQDHMQHMNSRLLPWHRVFLLLFEKALQNYHPDVTVPYWNWTDCEQQQFPDWLAGVLPTVQTPTRTITVVRAPRPASDLAAVAAGVPSAMGMASYNDFTGPINAIHGAIHIWVGGTMSDASVSPADPIFWLHHANLDRLWWTWFNSPQGDHRNPPLTGADAVMDPWTYIEADVRDLDALGYEYA